MKNQKVAEHYDKIYSDDEHAFSGEPLPLVKLLLEVGSDSTDLNED